MLNVLVIVPFSSQPLLKGIYKRMLCDTPIFSSQTAGGKSTRAETETGGKVEEVFGEISR